MNFQENFLIPLIEKSVWRYIQFAPTRYPAGDYKFKAYSTMGVMAKELEMTQLVQLMSMTQPGTPPHSMLLMSIFENSSVPNRDEMKVALSQTMQPDPQQQQIQQMVQQLQLMKLQMEIEEMKAGAMKDMAHAAKLQAEAQEDNTEIDVAKLQIELAEKMARIEKLRVETQNVQSETMRNYPEIEHLQSETVLNLAKARAQQNSGGGR